MRQKTMETTAFHVEREHAATRPVLVAQKIKREVFNEKLRVVTETLSVEGVEHGVSGSVGGGARPMGGRPFAEFRRHASERTLINLAVLGARERDSESLKLVDRLRSVAT